MRHTFRNLTPVNISSGAPNEITSSVQVAGVQGVVTRVLAAVNINHTWTNDLEMATMGIGANHGHHNCRNHSPSPIKL